MAMQRFIAPTKLHLTHNRQSGWPLDGAATITLMLPRGAWVNTTAALSAQGRTNTQVLKRLR